MQFGLRREKSGGIGGDGGIFVSGSGRPELCFGFGNALLERRVLARFEIGKFLLRTDSRSRRAGSRSLTISVFRNFLGIALALVLPGFPLRVIREAPGCAQAVEADNRSGNSIQQGSDRG